MFDVSNKTVIITGGVRGIGEAASRIFAVQGANVHALDLNKENGNRLSNELKTNFSFHHCDISNTHHAKKTINTIASIGKIDCLICCAGIAHIGNIEQASEEDMDRIYAVNIKGIYNVVKACIPIMKEQQNGVIINIASIASTVGLQDRFAYSMSKGAVLTMTYSIAKDYVKHNIRCNSISPARIHTPFVDEFLKANYPGNEQLKFNELAKTQPIGRMGKPEEVAALALYLCSDEASFITGTDFPIDGGFIKLNS